MVVCRPGWRWPVSAAAIMAVTLVGLGTAGIEVSPLSKPLNVSSSVSFRTMATEHPTGFVIPEFKISEHVSGVRALTLMGSGDATEASDGKVCVRESPAQQRWGLRQTAPTPRSLLLC